MKLQLSVPAFGVWAANTGIGKTLISAALANAVASSGDPGCFIKAAQTGFPNDSDGQFVADVARGEHLLGSHAAHLRCGLRGRAYPSKAAVPQSRGPWLSTTLFAWGQPISPHLAVQREGRAVSDEELIQAVVEAINSNVAGVLNASKSPLDALFIVETSGGVCSPCPSGALQVDVLRALRQPAVLVADGRLGGISACLSAHDSLTMRGYEVAAVAVMDPGDLDNAAVIQRQLRDSLHAPPPAVFTVPACPPPTTSCGTEELDAHLVQWLEDTGPAFKEMRAALQEFHSARLKDISSARRRARSQFWWPFTQHSHVQEDRIAVIEARVGERFVVAHPEAEDHGVGCSLESTYDASASWWTQGMSSTLQRPLAQSVAYAAGRYGHVMFPENAHKPALDLAEALLEGPGRGWASRVFFSDDGSTAVEVALKMAFRKYAVDHAGDSAMAGRERHVLTLMNGYHGDTLGAMDCSVESVFNSGQTPWYRARGLFLEPPTCGLRDGVWQVWPPAGACPSTETQRYEAIGDLFSPDRDGSDLAAHYRDVVAAAMTAHEAGSGAVLAACLLEPVLQGAGGMIFVDPLFQRVLIQLCRERGIPVIADEVFSGLWRLGRPSAMHMLHEQPDIACYAKLLTGGTVPLAATLASDAVFEAFAGDSAADALLHGHSYTAHPIGCQAGVASLRMLGDPRFNPNLQSDGCLRNMWDEAGVRQLSSAPAVERVVAIGTALAVELRPPQGQPRGYGSTLARAVTTRMRDRGVLARPLGNVVYMMCTPTSSTDTTASLLAILRDVLAAVDLTAGSDAGLDSVACSPIV